MTSSVYVWPCAAVPGRAPPSLNINLLVNTIIVSLVTPEHLKMFTTLMTHFGMVPAVFILTTTICCTNVGLPWFIREFPIVQHNKIEVRICTDATSSNEAVLVDQLKLYIQ